MTKHIVPATAQAVRGAFYIRISKEGYRSEAEVKAQLRRYREQCVHYAERKGLPLPAEADIIEETDVSGGLALEERGLGALIERVEAGELGYILSPDVDRFGRDTFYGTLAWRRVTGAGGRLLFADEDIDSSDTEYGDPQKEFERALVDGAAYRRKAGRRFAANVRDSVERGVHSGSIPPRGYVWPGVRLALPPKEDGSVAYRFKKSGPLLTVDEADEELLALWREHAPKMCFERGAFESIRAAFALVGSQEPRPWSWTDITRLLNVHSQASARSLLLNRAYIGEARSGSVVTKGAHTAAVDEETFERVQRRLAEKTAENGGKPRPRVRTPKALAKVMRCSECGGTLSPDLTMWRCKRHGCPSRGQGITDTLVRPWVIEQAVQAHRFLHLGFEVDAATVAVFEESVRDAEREAEEAADALGVKVDDLPPNAKPMQALAEARGALRSHEKSVPWVGQSEEAVQAMLAEGDPERINDFVRSVVRVFVSPCGWKGPRKQRTPETRCRVVMLDGSESPEVAFPEDAAPGSVAFPGPVPSGPVREGAVRYLVPVEAAS